MKFLMSWYRSRVAIFLAAGWAVILGVLLDWLVDSPDFDRVHDLGAGVLGIIVIATGILSAVRSHRLPEPAPRRVHSPVLGRWLGLNSPSSKCPSHGVRAYGQAYALDLVAEPESAERPAFGGPPMRASTEYPAFGQPVLSLIEGTVVRASDWRRDHRARSNLLGVGYLMVEGFVRELFGPGFILGNHVIVRSDDGVYAALAHLQRGSLTVRVGDRVSAGQPVGRCGNSGNSSEPHVHAQLMDRASTLLAIGLPMAFADIEVAGESTDQLPANNEHMIAFAPDRHPVSE